MYKQKNGARIKMNAKELADHNKEQSKNRDKRYTYKGKKFSSDLKDILDIDILITNTAIDQMRTLQGTQWTLMDLQEIHKGISEKYLEKEGLI